MAVGKAIPETVHWIVIRLSTIMSVDDIAMYTDISVCSVKRILGHFRKTGDINVPKRLRPQLHKSLCDYDIQVRFGFSFIIISSAHGSLAYVCDVERHTRSISR
jgi:hypothetical protein